MIGRTELIKIAVLLIIWVIIWMIYNVSIRPMYPNPLLDDPLTTFKILLPDCTKCYIKEVSTNPDNNDCTKEDRRVDTRSYCHLLYNWPICT